MSIRYSRYAGRAITVVFAMLMIGCGDTRRNGADTGAEADSQASLPGTAEVTDSSATASEPAEALGVVVFLGTSLTAGYGLRPEQAFPALLQQKIDEAGLPFRTVNAGVSGETSAGALRRVDWLLQQPFDILVVETGANDMLRGTEPAATEQNIQTIIDQVRGRRPDTTILLAGMLAMPNLGRDYGEQFEALYPRLAENNGVTLIPFLLDGVAGERSLNLGDGVHPNVEGQRIVTETVWEVLEPMLKSKEGRVVERGGEAIGVIGPRNTAGGLVAFTRGTPVRMDGFRPSPGLRRLSPETGYSLRSTGHNR